MAGGLVRLPLPGSVPARGRLLVLWVAALVALVAPAAAGQISAQPATRGAAARLAPTCAPTVADGAAAAAMARACGRPVEIGSLSTAGATVSARPDGGRTLVASPAGAPVDVHLSQDGTGPLASFALGQGVTALAWPAPLPRPTIEGGTAVYPGVLPGVDLRVRAAPDGFSTVLVVANRAAAVNPALREVRYRWTGAGESVRSRADGGLDVLDAGGAVVAGAPPAQMWDSSDRGSSALAPGDLARRAPVPARVDGADIVLTPDAAMLADPGLTYPVYIDPSFSRVTAPWAYADSSNSNNSDGVARVGVNPDGSGTYRTFFGFDTRALAGTHVGSATFRTTMTHSWACTSTPVDLYRTDNLPAGTANDARIGWAGPNLKDWIGELSGHAHKPSTGTGCADDPQPDMVLQFGGGLGGVVQSHATARDATMTFALTERRQDGSGEGTGSWWKKFSAGATALVVDFDSFPAAPRGLATAPASPCTSGTGRPVVNSASGVKLSAYLSDPDGGNLTGTFSWKPAGAADPGTALPVTASQASGTRFTTATGIPAASLVEGQSYAWRVQASDGTVAGPFSPWCEFTVDTTVPAGAPSVASPDLAAFPQPPPVTAVVGRPAAVTFTPAAGDTDVAGYWYGVAPGTPQLAQWVPAAADGTATLTVTPPAAGQVLSLAVQEADRAGNRSAAVTSYSFLAGAAAGWWPTTATGATSLDDASGQGHAIALQGGATVGAGVATLPTAAAFGATAAPVLDTSQSYSVAAWARLAATPTTVAAVVSQDGAHASAFRLQYRPDRTAWCFSVRQTDDVNAVTDLACATSPPQIGVWTHLAGVYDAAAQQIRLYVDGALAGSSAETHAWRAPGVLAVGRAQDAAATDDHLVGDVADLRAWQQAMDQPALAVLAAAPPAATRWGFDDATANTAADLSGVTPGHPLTASASGAVVGGSGHSGGSLVVDGAAGQAKTATAVVHTNRSFTVTAWARLDATGGGGQGIVGSQGAHVHSFRLAYDGPSNQWLFRTVATDANNVGGSTLGSPATAGTWTFLTGVWDGNAGQMRFYLGGVLQSQASVGVPFDATGPIVVGCDWLNSVNADFLDGQVDDVRIYEGVLSAAQIAALAAA